MLFQQVFQVPYEPLGGNAELWRSRDREVLLAGPAGTGKTRANLEKCYIFGAKYPRSRILFTRKVRASLSQSVLPLFERYVVPLAASWVRGASKAGRTSYIMPNQSEIVLAGSDNPERILSSEYDLIYVNEACELDIGDWETLLSRLRGGNSQTVPYRQLIADTNPSSPSHWLKKRCDEKKCKLIPSRHADNPTVTPEYLETLKSLSGHRRSRLYEGIWCAAEGLVFDLTKAMVEDGEVPDGEKVGGLDFGWNDPVAMVVATQYKDEMGRDVQYVFGEDCRNHTPLEVVAEKMLRLGGPDCIWFCDPSNPEGIRELNKKGVRAYPAINRVLFGIDQVCGAIEGGRLFVSDRLRSLVECCSGYIYDEDGIKPLKKDDHLADALRYMVASTVSKSLLEVEVTDGVAA